MTPGSSFQEMVVMSTAAHDNVDGAMSKARGGA
jgi:hypothetical protein